MTTEGPTIIADAAELRAIATSAAAIAAIQLRKGTYCGPEAVAAMVIDNLTQPDDVERTIVWRDARLAKPEDGKCVLCWHEGGGFVGYWRKESLWINVLTGQLVLGVTHWADPEGPRN
jgi:hypothetical protein